MTLRRPQKSQLTRKLLQRSVVSRWSVLCGDRLIRLQGSPVDLKFNAKLVIFISNLYGYTVENDKINSTNLVTQKMAFIDFFYRLQLLEVTNETQNIKRQHFYISY